MSPLEREAVVDFLPFGGMVFNIDERSFLPLVEKWREETHSEWLTKIFTFYDKINLIRTNVEKARSTFGKINFILTKLVQ